MDDLLEDVLGVAGGMVVGKIALDVLSPVLEDLFDF